MHFYDLGADAEAEAASFLCSAGGILPGEGVKNTFRKIGIDGFAVIGDREEIVPQAYQYSEQR